MSEIKKVLNDDELDKVSGGLGIGSEEYAEYEFGPGISVCPGAISWDCVSGKCRYSVYPGGCFATCSETNTMCVR